tara:strand:- start:553 stop:978 length:426 start_codon:yes stop_codon:yes gene_type:complete
MNYGEILGLFLIDLNSLFRNNIKIGNASFQQLIALSIIPSSGIEMTPLAKKIGIDNSTLTRLIIRLEKNGWVKREVSPHDKRVTNVMLTITGTRLQNDLEKQFEKIGDKVEQLVDPLERQSALQHIQSLHWILLKMNLKKQ